MNSDRPGDSGRTTIESAITARVSMMLEQFGLSLAYEESGISFWDSPKRLFRMTACVFRTPPINISDVSAFQHAVAEYERRREGKRPKCYMPCIIMDSDLKADSALLLSPFRRPVVHRTYVFNENSCAVVRPFWVYPAYNLTQFQFGGFDRIVRKEYGSIAATLYFALPRASLNWLARWHNPKILGRKEDGTEEPIQIPVLMKVDEKAR